LEAFGGVWGDIYGVSTTLKHKHHEDFSDRTALLDISSSPYHIHSSMAMAKMVTRD
jgi:hypothetical protein